MGGAGHLQAVVGSSQGSDMQAVNGGPSRRPGIQMDSPSGLQGHFL